MEEDEEAYNDYDDIFGGEREREEAEAGISARDIEARMRKEKERGGMGGFGEDKLDEEAINAYYRNRYNEDAIAQIRSLSPDLIIVVAYGLLLPKDLLDIPQYGCLNLHPSLLPKYLGPTPVVTSFKNGDTSTGISLMLLDPGMDTGPVISQEALEINNTDTAETLTHRLFERGADLLIRSIAPWAERTLKPHKQDDSQATITMKITREDGLADWSLQPIVLDRYRRAFTPWPGLYSHWDGKLIKFLETSYDTSIRSTNPPGSVLKLSSSNQGIGVVSGNGILELNTLQLEGKSAISGADFLKGYPSIEHAILK